VSTAVVNPPEETVTLEALLTVGPDGLTVSAKLTVPVKLFTLVMVTVDAPAEPALMLILLGLTPTTKSGVVLVEKMAAWTVSGSAVSPPLAIVTHTPPLTLVAEEHPVWKVRGVFELVPVIL